jgi:hypothetical protein
MKSERDSMSMACLGAIQILCCCGHTMQEHCVKYQDAAEVRLQTYLAYRRYLDRRTQLESSDRKHSIESNSNTE